MSRFVISCGGTGGHLSPGISVAEVLIDRGHDCWLVISRKQVDARLIEDYPQLEFVRAPGSPLSGNPLGLIYFIFGQIRLTVFALRFFCKVKPEAVMAFGGFASGGIAVAAFFRKCPLVLHEANRVIGKAIRILARFALRIYLPEEVTVPWQKRASQVRHFGYPVRRQIQKIPRVEAREEIGITEKGKLVVIVGGSQGAQALNDWASQCLEDLAMEGVSLYCVTGLGKGHEKLKEVEGKNGKRIKAHFIPFTNRMGEVLSSADLVVSRAGAGTIAELIQCQVPAILIPYPYAADDHQIANAHYLQVKGGCVVLEQRFIGKLTGAVLDLIGNDERLRSMRQDLERLENKKTSDVIAEDLEQIASGSSNRITTGKVEISV
ncbi:MAG: UDP-N-acetylglucosamine--N-acetylmuramyl-(pentapeptide) pyrophosphoryl-undecaprenol N-acetylglucosamine transferase [Candidatus Moanabacter tarae]|uniref:UDP-N-acetylglucosamine--N-acetylmuramyl-(pentapeptide) pyrophosphoryl-undecaprenol N-acetylglucosamine transferase n=1 Tax=Candidatus Moanibacter tarae TaxID=2200854 RepID=A0A2Z4AFB1_9BACT|nr:MAG: UDP-N-acetylglucosamine--N-acetylmuramyl-(pentapeptide) pyrophosphoryl-undecaprenol N-acetylglucosamine transferase [Candidatus Moanabacter tarae]|tara:strand:+ start:411 stop:1544 length:1134 start_codon:yes stop_codon:yes gene_type:complete